MPNPFDHLPRRTETAYGPSIHNDPVAMENATLRDGGLTRIEWADAANALRLTVDARALVTELLLALADVPVDVRNRTLDVLALFGDVLRRIERGENVDVSLERLRDDLDDVVTDMLAECGVLTEAVATVRGPAAMTVGLRVIEALPAEVILAWGRIERARRQMSLDA